MARSQSERPAELAEACAGDQALRRHMETLLEAPATAERWFAAPASHLGLIAPMPNATNRIGPYEIVAPIGAGGMGEVYRAWDTRLAREVALKVLPADVAEDVGRRRRFLEEARAAGRLNHPNILAVYDVSDGEGTPFIASELLDGRQLRWEIDRGPLAMRRLLDLAAQIAAGLRAAHENGLVHRDLKPENVMITRDGRVKILDFGLAKMYAAEPGELGPTTVTVPGVIVGTPPYMSPEQASGGAVDFRSDQFSLGVILYEMATGVHPFRRHTAVQTMAAIVGDEARPIAELNAKVPTLLRWVIERCLAKDPADRYASTTDLAKDLAMLQGRLTQVSGDEVRPVAAPRKSTSRWILTAGVLVAAATATFVLTAGTEPAPLKFTPLVTDGRFQGGPAWSRDGATLAYAVPVDGVLQIFTKSLASPVPHQVTTSRFDCVYPFWSRDGTRIYYHSLAHDSESLWSVSPAGGTSELVVENAINGTISPDGSTLVFLRGAAPQDNQTTSERSIWVATAAGTSEQRYMQPPFDSRTFVDGVLRFSPDGSKLLARVWGWSDGTSNVTSPEFWVLPWPTGEPYRVLPALSRAAPIQGAFDWLPDGRRIVAALWDQATTSTHLWVADIGTGETTPLTSTTSSENEPAVAPDGQSVAFNSLEVDYDLFEIPLNGAPLRSLLTTSRNELEPTFSPDGSQYAYVSDRGGVMQIWLRSRDGRVDRPVVGPDQFPDEPTLAFSVPALSPKGDQIAYQRYGERTGYQVWISTVAGAGPPVRLAAGFAYYQDAPTWSPDGAWIAFMEATKQRTSVLSKAQIGVNDRPEVILRGTSNLMSRPVWSPDGRWIACDTSEDGLVIVTPGGKESRSISQESWIAYTWSKDSRHIVGLRESDRPHRFALASVNIETREERVINSDLGVIPPVAEAIRGLAFVDAEVLATSIASARSDIWLLKGLSPAGRSWWSRFWGRN